MIAELGFQIEVLFQSPFENLQSQICSSKLRLRLESSMVEFYDEMT